jgi:hypothetical protein
MAELAHGLLHDGFPKHPAAGFSIEELIELGVPLADAVDAIGEAHVLQIVACDLAAGEIAPGADAALFFILTDEETIAVPRRGAT